jgi:hypothetical protein
MPWPKGQPKTEEQRAKISAGVRANPPSVEGRRGKPLTDEHKAKIAAGYRKSRPVRMADCHPDRKHKGKGLCHSCYMVQWMKDHPDCNSGNNWSKSHPEQFYKAKRIADWKRRGIKITWEQYESLWFQQGGKCANSACSQQFPLKVPDHRFGSLQVDHDHDTGEVRGLLCTKCNRALGLLLDDIDMAKGLVDYLLQ